MSLCLIPAPGHSQNKLGEQAAALMQQGRFHEAELLWRQLTLNQPRNASAHANLGLALARQGDFWAASSEYRRALALEPNEPAISFDLGLAEFKQGHFEKAIPAFKKASAADRRVPVLLGMSYFGLHQYSDAIPYLEEAGTVDATNLELRSILAKSCLWSKRYDCALAEMSRARNSSNCN